MRIRIRLRRMFGTGIVLSAGLYIVLVTWAMSRLSSLSGGRPSPDLWVGGYGVPEVEDYLSHVPDLDALYAFYVGPLRVLDTAFPIVMSLTLALGLWLFAGRARWLLVVALAYGIIDLTENFLLAWLIWSGPEAVSSSVVFWANLMTQSKYVVFLVSFLATVGAIIKARQTA